MQGCGSEEQNKWSVIVFDEEARIIRFLENGTRLIENRSMLIEVERSYSNEIDSTELDSIEDCLVETARQSVCAVLVFVITEPLSRKWYLYTSDANQFCENLAAHVSEEFPLSIKIGNDPSHRAYYQIVMMAK